MRKIIFLLAALSFSSPVLAMNWDEMGEGMMRGFNEEGAKQYKREQKQKQRATQNKALAELNIMVNQIINAPNSPETRPERLRRAGNAALQALSTNPDLLSLPPEIYTQYLEVFQRMANAPD